MRPDPHARATLARELEPVLADAVRDQFLRCSSCGAEQHPSSDEMARYFRGGWPECCGETMRLTAHGERP